MQNPTSVDDALVLTGITKTYPGVRALGDVSVTVVRGKVHAILGENGAGKSTLVGIAAGSVVPDSGTIGLGGEDYTRIQPRTARERGLAIVYQTPALAPSLSVLDAVLLLLPESKRPKRRGAAAWLTKHFESLGLKIDPGATISSLSLREAHLIEIAAALASGPSVLVLDEPTEALGPEETRWLFDRIQELLAQDVAIVYITHRIPEVVEIATDLTVLRDGKVVGRGQVADFSADQIVELIVGRSLETTFPDKASIAEAPEAPTLEVLELSGPGFSDVSFSVLPGQIVGIAGVEGNGQREFLRGLAGRGATSGKVLVQGREVSLRSQRATAREGIAFLPGDRIGEAMFGKMSIRENVVAPSLNSAMPAGFVDRPREYRMTRQAIAGLAVRTPTLETPVTSPLRRQPAEGPARPIPARRPARAAGRGPDPGCGCGCPRRDLRVPAGDGRVRRRGGRPLDGRRRARGALRPGHGVLARQGAGQPRRSRRHRALDHRRGRAVDRSLGLHHHCGAEEAAWAVGRRPWRGAGGHPGRTDPDPGHRDHDRVLRVPESAQHHPTARRCGGTRARRPRPAAGRDDRRHRLEHRFGRGAPAGVVVSFFGQQGPAYFMVGIVLAIVAGLVVGLVNGLLVTRLGLPPVIATLVTSIAVVGVAQVLRPFPGGSSSGDIMFALGTAIGGVPLVLVVALVLAGLTWFVVQRTRLGRGLRAAGSDPVKANRMGVSVPSMRLFAALAAGLLAAIAGLVLYTKTGIGDANTGQALTLTSVTAIVIAGASIFGGSGSAIAVAAAGILLQTITNALAFLSLSLSWQYWLQGAFVLFAAIVPMVARYRRRRRSAGA